MAIRFKKIQTNFTSGEVSPRLLARVDLDTYANAVKTMENAFTLPHGGAKRRDGSVFIGEVSNSTLDVRLLPFVYSESLAYILVINDGKLQFVRDGAFVMDGGSRVELTVPYGEGELEDISYSQFGSSIFFAHPNHPPKQLTRTSETSWTLSDMSFQYNAVADYWFDNAYVQFKIITTGDGFDVNDKFVFTTDGAGNVTGPTFTGTGTGSMVSITVDSNLDTGVTWTAICTLSTPDRQEFDVFKNTSPAYPPVKWYTGNYPACVALHEQRLWFAGSSKYPQTLWGSKIGNFLEFTLGPADDDGVEFTIASNKFDKVTQMDSARHLLLFSYGGEFSVAGGQNSGITPSMVQIRSHTSHGVTSIKPQRLGEEVLFAQRGGEKLRAVSYDVTLDANVAPDITLIAEHITGEGLTDLTYSSTPNQLLWATREDGVLLSCTHLRSQEVTAWARHITEGGYISITTIPEVTGDTVYLAVEREIDGTTKKYIEYFDPDIYSDAALTGNSDTPTNVWSGLDHLEGKVVAVVGDGRVHPYVTVTSGTVSLQENYSSVQIGLPFNTKIELLHPEVNSSEGSSQGSQLSINEATFRLQDTIGFSVNGKPVPVMTTNIVMDTAPTPFTGDKKVNLLGWDKPNNLLIEQNLPAPFTLLGVVLKLNTGD